MDINARMSDVKASKFATRRKFLMNAKMPFTEIELYQCERALAQWASQQLDEWSAASRHISGCAVNGSGITTAALRLVVEERTKQMQRGYDRNHDAAHKWGAIAEAAASLALRSTSAGGYDSRGAVLWPWPDQQPKRTTRLHDAVMAAALAVAEVERLLNAEFYGSENGYIICEVYPGTWIAGRNVDECVRFAENEFGANGVSKKEDGYPKLMDKEWCDDQPYHDEDGRMIGSFASVLATMATDGKTEFPCYFAGEY